jgi:hypothetical protein
MRNWLLLSAMLLASCGGKGAIFLTIDARGLDGALQIPADADHVSVVVTRPDGAALLEKDYPLDPAAHRFPLTLALEQGDKTGARVKLEVRVHLADVEKGYATTTVLISPEEVNEVTVRIETQ